MSLGEQSLEYHRRGRKGKIEVVTTKPCHTQLDLSLAYTPGVAEPCRRIHADPNEAYEYTAKGNLVAVITNGTAVLGLGDIGALAGKPVMEGKAVLFKRFADIDVFDIELDTRDSEAFIAAVKLMEPTFGGINLEDIKAPECFEIEERLKAEMDIPVFHDDQHGTAIITGASLINALELVDKKPGDIRVVFSGAGASAISCARLYVQLGVPREQIVMCDSKGVIYKGRDAGMNRYKDEFAAETEARTLADAMAGADVFIGLSQPNIVTRDMLRVMADKPLVFALANPDPEITYEEAMAARDDIIMGTGRSDYPNQVNNVLGFPFIFRGALDVRARAINDEMKIAAARSLAELAKEPVPYQVITAYRLEGLEFGPEYIIPKPFDPRVLIWEAAAVAKAAMETGVARQQIDIEEYRETLESRLGLSRKVMRRIINKARKAPKRIVFPEGDHPSILKACETILDEGLAHPILLGSKKRIEERIEQMRLNLEGGVEIIDMRGAKQHERYAKEYFRLRQRKGVTLRDARAIVGNRNTFGIMMVHAGDADGMVSGLLSHYPETIRPALQVIGPREDVDKVAGMYMLVFKEKVYFVADCTVNVNPSAEDIAGIALLCAQTVRRFDFEPRVALVSFSNFGSARYPESDKVRRAVELVRERDPGLVIDGEVQADAAVTPEIMRENYPFSVLEGDANVLIFPNLDAGNAVYKLLKCLGGAEAVGPILLGMNKPVHLLQIGGFNEIDVVNMTAIAVLDAQ
ncbi:MAG: NADP-dependent malic enzyme [Candidatus Hydrogenedentes bacterium]|nr:NADP-dependent malic enzyme [Candidatus Hydrogenedentota bacterium]